MTTAVCRGRGAKVVRAKAFAGFASGHDVASVAKECVS
jgi:hypothetical protein